MVTQLPAVMEPTILEGSYTFFGCYGDASDRVLSGHSYLDEEHLTADVSILSRLKPLS